MVEMPISKLINAVLVLMVIVIVLGAIFLFYTKVLLPQTKADFESLPSGTQASINSVGDNFISSLEACKSKQNNDCMCRNSLVRMPETIDIQLNDIPASRHINLNFLYNGKNFKSGTMQNVQISNMFYDGEAKIIYDNVLSFSKYTFNNNKILSNDIYKRNGSLFLITYKSKTALFFGKSEAEQKAFFSKIPEC